MESPDRFASVTELVTLREAIKERYQTYHRQDRLRFPLFEFNTNRTNYEPLRESFEEEFFVQRGVDRQQKTIHIPSTTTLSLLFTDESYQPSLKIWNTCWSYVEKYREEKEPRTTPAAETVVRPTSVVSHPTQPKAVLRNSYNWLVVGGLGLVVGLLLGVGVILYVSPSITPKTELSSQNETGQNRLRITRPISKSRVSPTFIVYGMANPKETVWLVTRFEGTDMYWVQFPALAGDKGVWFQAIDVRGEGYDRAGKKHEVRAFVNPVNELRVGDVLLAWPKAERSTAVVDVVMDPSRSTRDYAN